MRLAAQPTASVQIDITIDPIAQATAVTVDPVSIVFATDNWAEERTVTITADEDDNKVSESMGLIHTYADAVLATVRVTVRDNDIPPSASVGAGLVRFGRTVGEQSVVAITDRLSGIRQPGFSGRLAGQTLPEVRCAADGEFIRPESSCVVSGQQPGSNTPGVDAMAFGSAEVTGSDNSLTPNTTDELVAGTAFALTQAIDTGALVTLWGQGTRSGFSGREQGYAIKGHVSGFQLGFDWARHNRFHGVIMARSTGEADYGDAAARNGEVAFGLTSIVPYTGWRVDDDYLLWGGLGFGTGNLTWQEVAADEIRTGLRWRMVAFGSEGSLPEVAGLGNAELRWHTDVLWTQTGSAEVPDYLEALQGKTLRHRMGVTSTWENVLASGVILRPSLGVAVRRDSGDAEQGLGLQVSGGLEWLDMANGVSWRLRGQKLLAHKDDAFESWGVSVALLYDPNPSTRQGFAASLSHAVGEPPVGDNSHLIQAASLPEGAAFNADQNWTAEMAYGVSRGHGKVGSSYVQVHGGSSDETARLGYRLEPDIDQAQNMMVDVWTEPAAGGTGDRATGNSVGVDLVSRW